MPRAEPQDEVGEKGNAQDGSCGDSEDKGHLCALVSNWVPSEVVTVSPCFGVMVNQFAFILLLLLLLSRFGCVRLCATP